MLGRHSRHVGNRQKCLLFGWWSQQTQILTLPAKDTKKGALFSAESWEVPLQRAVSPFSGREILTARNRLACFILFNYLFSLKSTEIPFVPRHQFSSPRSPSAYWQSTPHPIAFFVKVSPGRACNDYNITFVLIVTNKYLINLLSFPNFSWRWQKTPTSFENTLMW